MKGGISARKLAALAGVSHETARRYLKGEKVLEQAKLSRAVVGLSLLDWLEHEILPAAVSSSLPLKVTVSLGDDDFTFEVE